MLSSTQAHCAQHKSFTIPAFLAYSAAVLLALSSAAINVGSAISRHPDMLGKAVSGSIALAVTGLILIALPVCLSAVRDRNWTTAAIAALAWTMAATFSVSAALGTLGKPRLESAIHTAADDKSRTRLDAERTRATGELATLAPARPASELNSIIAAKISTPGANGCIKVDGPVSTKVCAEVASLQEEASRSTRMSALSGQIARVDGELRSLGKQSIASPDAAAIVAVLAVLGIVASVETMNVVLLIIGVAIVEIGPGIAASLAAALRTVAPSVPVMRDVTPVAPTLATEAVAVVPAASVPAIIEAPVAASATVTAAAERIAELVRNAGGTLHVQSKREISRMIEASAPTTNRALVALAGVVSVATSADGIAVKLVA